MNNAQTVWLNVHQIHHNEHDSQFTWLFKFPKSAALSRGHRFSSRPPFIAMVLILVSLFSAITIPPEARGLSQNDAIGAATSWLTSHQLADGSYGGFTESQTAPAARALWIRSGESANVLLAFRWLKNQIQNSSTWFWGTGGNPAEADIPGEILYSFAETNNLQMLNSLPAVASMLIGMQDRSSGGFKGYEITTLPVASSVDTSMALLGLIGARSISVSNETAAVNYLLTLQNADGSFNLTKTVSSSSLYSLGPEPISATALVLLALRSASVSQSDLHFLAALNYLHSQASTNFNGHVYAASLALLVFASLSDTSDTTIADNYILSQQNSDGGFRDSIRASTGSNALDTGWAAISLQVDASISSTFIGGGGKRPVAV